MGHTERVPRMRGLTFAAVALACLATPVNAGAHLRSGTVAVDYQASVRHPDTPAYATQVFQSDRALGITVKSGHTVVLLGYLGEPVFRLDDAGLWVNQTSPTAAADRLAPKTKPTTATGPEWRLRRGRHSVVWQDARVQGLPAGVARGVWSVPLIVDGHRSRLDGRLHRFPAPLLWPWPALLAGILSAAVLPMRTGRADRVRAEAIWLALLCALASTVLAVVFALDPYASPGTWIESADGIVFIAVGVGVILRGPRHWHAGAAIGLGLLGVGIGLSKGAVFFHPIALAILSGTVVRYAGITAIGAGGGAAALGCWIYARAPDQVSGPERWELLPPWGSTTLPASPDIDDGRAGGPPHHSHPEPSGP
jgi:hypothetical protein